MRPGVIVVGVYWTDAEGRRAEPVLFQVARMREGKIARLDDYRSRKRALRVARKAA